MSFDEKQWLVDKLQRTVDQMADAGLQITFVTSTSGNRIEVFDLNKGLHWKDDYRVSVPNESEVLRIVAGEGA